MGAVAHAHCRDTGGGGRTSSRVAGDQRGWPLRSMSVTRTPSWKSDGPATMRTTMRKSIRSTAPRRCPRAALSARSVTFCDSGEPLQQRQPAVSRAQVAQGPRECTGTSSVARAAAGA